MYSKKLSTVLKKIIENANFSNFLAHDFLAEFSIKKGTKTWIKIFNDLITINTDFKSKSYNQTLIYLS